MSSHQPKPNAVYESAHEVHFNDEHVLAMHVRISDDFWAVTVTTSEDGTFGEITTNFKGDEAEPNREGGLFDAAADALESLILAQACAGFDVTAPNYIVAVETALGAMANRYA